VEERRGGGGGFAWAFLCVMFACVRCVFCKEIQLFLVSLCTALFYKTDNFLQSKVLEGDNLQIMLRGPCTV
jgi:hypothetical protein